MLQELQANIMDPAATQQERKSDFSARSNRSNGCNILKRRGRRPTKKIEEMKKPRRERMLFVVNTTGLPNNMRRRLRMPGYSIMERVKNPDLNASGSSPH